MDTSGRELQMKIEISGRHFNLTDALKEHVEKKLMTVERFYNGIENIHVILEVTSGTNHVHIQLRGNHLKLDSTSKSHDIYIAFDEAFDSLEYQLRKFKDKKHSHAHRKQGTNGSLNISTYFVPAEESEFNEGIFLDDTAEVPRLKTDEAIMKFEIESDEHFVFHNLETGSLSIVYSTRAGNAQVVELVEST